MTPPIQKTRKLSTWYTSAQADYAVTQYALRQVNDKPVALTWGLPTIDAAGVPLFPGQIAVIQACTHEGKSTLMAWWVRRIADGIKAQPMRADGIKNVVVYAKLEETVELARVMTWGKPQDFREIVSGTADMKRLTKIAYELAGDPIVYVGQAVMADMLDPADVRYVRTSPSQLVEIHKQLVSEMKYNPIAYFVDGLQLMRDDADDREKWRQVQNISTDLVSFAKYAKAPVICSAQTKLNEVKSRSMNDRYPRIDDIQHSSQIAQDADVVLGLWKPGNDPDFTLGYDTVRVNGTDIKVTKDLVLMRVNKFRLTDLVGQVIPLTLSAGGKFGNLGEIDLKGAVKL